MKKETIMLMEMLSVSSSMEINMYVVISKSEERASIHFSYIPSGCLPLNIKYQAKNICAHLCSL